MNELIFDEGTKQFGNLLFELTKSIGGNLWEYAKNKNKDIENYFYQISSKYIERFHKRYGYIQVLGMNEPMSLTNVYVDVNFLDTVGINKYFAIDKLKKDFENSKIKIRNFQVSDGNKLEGIKVAEKESRLVVVGAPGGGKSTFLKKIGMECLKPGSESFLKKFIPVLIELKNINQENDIHSLVLKELEISGFPNPPEFLEKALEKGRIILLFDGLDEVSTDLEALTLTSIKDLCDQYHSCKFVVSCRIAAYKGGLPNFKNIEIANLDKKQIEDFIKKWFQEKSKSNTNSIDISKKCWEKINDEEFHATLELAQTPLLLTLLCLVFNDQQDFPKNRALLYREAIGVLLKGWNAEKRIHSNTVYKDMTLPFEELLLSHIAHNYFIKDELFFDKIELSSFISDYISSNLNAPKFLDGSGILEAISIQQGILVERVRNIYSFSHLTFQEYFTAKYIDDYNMIDIYIEKNLFQPKWREIFILLCGIMKVGSDKLLESIINKANRDVKYDKNLEKLQEILDSIDVKNDFETRILNYLLVLIFATNYKEVLSSYHAFQKENILLRELSPELYEQFSNSWIIDLKPHIDMHFELYFSMIQKLKDKTQLAEILEVELIKYKTHKSLEMLKINFVNAIGFEPIVFNSATLNIINTYFENLIFLIQCKKASILVTRDRWNIIESKVLKFMNE